MFIREAMAKEIWTCHADEPLAAAARIIWDHDVGAVPVVDLAGKLAGIITDRDICMAAYITGKPLDSEPVGIHMATQVFPTAPTNWCPR
jgi:CBS domain-containing protein